MTLDEAKKVSYTCSSLVGKTFDGKYVLAIMIVPYERNFKIISEMIQNVINETSYLNAKINNEYEYFDVFVLYYDREKEESKRYYVTPINEVLQDIFNKHL